MKVLDPNYAPLSNNYDAKARLLVRLSILYDKLKSMDQGDNLWRQVGYFRRSQGNQCPLIGELSKQFPMDTINIELTNLEQEWNRLNGK